MADNNETLNLEWTRKDDNSGGFHEHLDKAEGVLYRTWEVPHGARPSQHVLVKSDGFSQRALGYFESRHAAMAKAESLTKEGQQLDLTPNSVAQTAKVEKADNSGLRAVHAAQKGTGGGRIDEDSSAEGSASSGSSVGKGSKPWEGSSSSRSGSSETSTASSVEKADESGISAVRSAQSKGGYETSEGMGASGASYSKSEPGGTSGERDFFSMSEKCGKCGSKADACCCGNLGKSELCKKCNKATNLCKCSGMTKSVGLASQAAVAEAEHKAAIEAGKALLQKSLATGTPDVNVFGTAKDGSTTGVDPQAVQQRLHNLYVAARFALDSAAKK
jgi:hypothetical protein